MCSRRHDEYEDKCMLCGRPKSEVGDLFKGPDGILVCPVFDRGAESVTVLLPRNAEGWRLRGEGEILPGGASLTVPCLPTDLPVWFERADGIKE